MVCQWLNAPRSKLSPLASIGSRLTRTAAPVSKLCGSCLAPSASSPSGAVMNGSASPRPRSRFCPSTLRPFSFPSIAPRAYRRRRRLRRRSASASSPRAMLAISPHLRRLWQLPRPAVRERLLGRRSLRRPDWETAVAALRASMGKHRTVSPHGDGGRVHV
jgi:hypothetical protein